MRRTVRLLAEIVILLLLIVPAWADPPATAPPAKPSTLADVLKALPPQSLPQDTLILTVGAEGERSDWRGPTLVPGTNIDINGNVVPPPPDSSTIQGILTLYNRTWQTFGKVAAIAPTQMTELNVDLNALSQIDPVALSPSDAMKILLGSLTQSQWQEVGSGGLGLDELDQAQSALFRAAVRTPLKIVPSTASWNPLFGQPGFDFNQYQQNYDSQVQTLTSDMLAGARLEAHLATMYLLPVPDVQNREWMDESGSAGMPGVYQISEDGSYQQDNNPLSSLIRVDLPNTLKPSELNWNITPLRATIDLTGVKTVDDIITRVARATGLELYCDPHYASRSVLVLDTTGRPQRARDLLEGLCVCLSGTWRQVGPAYVLTNDIEGLAGKRFVLKAMANGWTNQVRNLADKANDSMVDKDWARSLQFLPNDPNALTPDQMKQLEDKAAGPNTGNDWLDLDFSQIPSSAQDALKKAMGRFAGNNADSDFGKVSGALGPDYKMNAQLQVRVFLDVPSIGQVALDQGSYYTDLSMRKRSDRSLNPPPPSGKAPPPASLPANEIGFLCAPHNADEARAVVDKLAGLGLHLLYCEAFTNGKAYFANPAFPPASSEAAVLPAAIQEGKAKGVKVVAVIDTFAWGQGDLKTRLAPLPRGFSEDETSSLEPASDALREKGSGQADPQPGMLPVTLTQWVSPADSAVQGALMQLVNTVARIPGLAGILFQDAAPPSYLSKPNTYDPQSLPLGYTPEARLAFLRAYHADPIDFGDDDNNLNIWVGSGIGNTNVRLDIPSYDYSPTGANLQPAWEKMRKQADTDALARLYGVVRGINASIPLYLRGLVDSAAIQPWTNPVLSDSQTAEGGFNPANIPPGTQLILPWSMMRSSIGMFSQLIPELNNLFAKAKTPLFMVFDLAQNASPDGPVRDLEVISEHVHFTSAPAPQAPAKAAAR